MLPLTHQNPTVLVAPIPACPILVASTDSTCYTSLEEALKVAQSIDTISINSDIVVQQALTITQVIFFL